MDNSELKLYWDSWDRHHLRSGPSPRPLRSLGTRSSVPSEDSIPYNNNNNNNNLNSDTLAQASSVISISSNTSPPSTPHLTMPGHRKFYLAFFAFIFHHLGFSSRNNNL